MHSFGPDVVSGRLLTPILALPIESSSGLFAVRRTCPRTRARIDRPTSAAQEVIRVEADVDSPFHVELVAPVSAADASGQASRSAVVRA
jgi:hypothetical protein